LREAKRTHILCRKKPALEWCRLFFEGTLNRGEGRDFVFATGRGGSRAPFFCCGEGRDFFS
jgi:hypothetical protein